MHILRLLLQELFWFKKIKATQKKSHACEGGAHSRISVWHLLMNLKNNYLLKKKLLKCANKICILIFTKIKQKEKKKNICRYHYFISVYQQSL